MLETINYNFLIIEDSNENDRPDGDGREAEQVRVIVDRYYYIHFSYFFLFLQAVPTRRTNRTTSSFSVTFPPRVYF